MSISLLIKPAGAAGEARLVPIATETAFRKYWHDGCEALGLQWVPAFRAGMSVRREDIPDIVRELLELKDWMQNPSNRKSETAVVARLENLVSELRSLESGEPPAAEIYIG